MVILLSAFYFHGFTNNCKCFNRFVWHQERWCAMSNLGRFNHATHNTSDQKNKCLASSRLLLSNLGHRAMSLAMTITLSIRQISAEGGMK